MRALIRDLKTGRFYAPVWQWTHKREKAWDIGSTFQALNFAEDNRLRGIEVVLAFDEPEKEVTVSVDVQGRWPTFYGERHVK
jgi:hypothetical protein